MNWDESVDLWYAKYALIAASGILLLAAVAVACRASRRKRKPRIVLPRQKTFCHFDQAYWSGERKVPCDEAHPRTITFCSFADPYPGFWCVEARFPCAAKHLRRQWEHIRGEELKPRLAARA